MKLSSLKAISPIDGRYSEKVNELRKIFSEFNLIKLRVTIEILWLRSISNCKSIKEVNPFNKKVNDYLNNIIKNFNEQDARHIKLIEKNINHDVKAVEYFLKKKISKMPELKKISEFIHFACTSEDINNLSYALMLSDTRKNVLLPIWLKLIKLIKQLSIKYKKLPILSRTHGQPASPSTIGKEMANFSYRLLRQYIQFKKIKILGKINGAVGNYNAHVLAYPNLNWQKFSKKFVNSLGICWNKYTTQIEPHDYISEMCSCISRFNTIIINFNRDMWNYISLNYFKQKVSSKYIGSSTMPHKVNPISFENSEGNLGLSNAIINYIAMTINISRLQRDLTDSTILRNIGVGISHAIIAYKSTIFGIKKLQINKFNVIKDLEKKWELLSEPIQTIMRKYNINKSYEKIKKFIFYKKNINYNDIKSFVDKLSIPQHEKEILKNLTPKNYIGYATKLVDQLKIDI